MDRLCAGNSVLLVVDMQTRLLPAIHDHAALLARASALVQAALLLDVPVLATEHCADRIGPTEPGLAQFVQRTIHKTHFDAAREPGMAEELPSGRPNVLLIGTEAHVCVLQTAMGLAAAGRHAIMVADCVGSRTPLDHRLALGRAAQRGIEVASMEMAMFEWLASADHPRFREVLALVKGAPPPAQQGELI
ncbi:isochorismatase family protein [Candidimonas nitroreducens]|uniref:Isochorismatase n=1 Tax=Candidimonas nitroreducens TaxID=683354 RepID=A0A225MKL1_9BURK|nr:isochorismatase family protein [Candidimonas nitroreducens]OWT61784.1 isochorismatase [Candidimonas nitroreducens]